MLCAQCRHVRNQQDQSSASAFFATHRSPITPKAAQNAELSSSGECELIGSPLSPHVADDIARKLLHCCEATELDGLASGCGGHEQAVACILPPFYEHATGPGILPLPVDRHAHNDFLAQTRQRRLGKLVQFHLANRATEDRVRLRFAADAVWRAPLELLDQRIRELEFHI